MNWLQFAAELWVIEKLIGFVFLGILVAFIGGTALLSWWANR